jgi:hypothetical protein
VVLENQRSDARTSLRLSVDDVPVEIDIGPRASTVATMNVRTARRGWLPMPRLTIETTWPLGLVRAWSYAGPNLNCLVYPTPAVKAPPLPWSSDSTRGSTKDGRGADDFSGLRNHQAADPPRHVAWKAVARQQDGPLLTKLFTGAAAQQVWLDWDALPDIVDTEQRLSVLARWMLDADAAGLAWGLRMPGIRLAYRTMGRHNSPPACAHWRCTIMARAKRPVSRRQAWWLLATALGGLRSADPAFPLWLTLAAGASVCLARRTDLAPVASAATLAAGHPGHGRHRGRLPAVSHHTRPNAGIALLVVFLALKLLELRAARDAIVTALLCYFLVLGQFLFTQTIPTAMLACITVLITTATLLAASDDRPNR